MKQITIIVKPFRAEALLKALAEMEIDSFLIREVKGYSRQKGYLDRYAGSEYSEAFLPKIEINLEVPDERVDEVVHKAREVARTGRMGDGKIFITPISWPEPLEF